MQLNNMQYNSQGSILESGDWRCIHIYIYFIISNFWCSFMVTCRTHTHTHTYLYIYILWYVYINESLVSWTAAWRIFVVQYNICQMSKHQKNSRPTRHDRVMIYMILSNCEFIISIILKFIREIITMTFFSVFTVASTYTSICNKINEYFIVYSI